MCCDISVDVGQTGTVILLSKSTLIGTKLETVGKISSLYRSNTAECHISGIAGSGKGTIWSENCKGAIGILSHA